MITDKNLCYTRKRLGGEQRIYRFKDGHGLSLINDPSAHFCNYAWEAAVLENVSEGGQTYEITYDTELTADVKVFATDEEANDFINRAEKLFNK